MEVDGDEIANIVENTVEEDETTTGALPDSKRQKAMSKRSWIWAHYETLPLCFDKIPREKCKYCSQIYQNRSENGTDKPCEEFAEDIASELTTEASTQNSNNMVVLRNQDAN